LIKRGKINGGLRSYLQDMFDAVFALTLRRSVVTFPNQFINNLWKWRSCQGEISCQASYVNPWWRAKKQHRMWPDVDVYVFVHHRREIWDQPSYQVRCPHHFKNSWYE